MSDNTTLNTGSGGDVIRDIARQSGSVKTQVVQLDAGGPAANAEVLITAGQQDSAVSLPTIEAWDKQHSAFEIAVIDLLQKLVFPSGVVQPLFMSPFQELAQNVRAALIEVQTNFNYPSGVAPVTGAFAATGQSSPFKPIYGRSFNISVWGTFSGTVQLERTFDNGTNWLPVTAGGVGAYVWTAPASESTVEDEVGVAYRFNCTAYTSGTVNYRMSQ